jgi:hypothetical protein
MNRAERRANSDIFARTAEEPASLFVPSGHPQRIALENDPSLTSDRDVSRERAPCELTSLDRMPALAHRRFVATWRLLPWPMAIRVWHLAGADVRHSVDGG